MEIREYLAGDSQLQKILHELPDDMLEKIKIRQLKSGETVIDHCEDNYYTYIILKGVCCTLNTFGSGKRIILQMSTVYDVIGFTGIFETRNQFQASIFAKTPATLAVLPRPVVLYCFGRYQDFSTEITSCIMRRLHSMIQLLSECNNYPLMPGLITYLIHAYRFYLRQYPSDFNGEIKVLESRQEIADFLGVDVRSIHRIVPRLAKTGQVQIRAGHIYIDRENYMALLKAQSDWFIQK